MGYGIIPDLTTDKWMCLEPCQHKDCAAMKADFVDNANCLICNQPLLAGDKFYYTEHGKNSKVHFVCELERIEKERS